MEMKQKFELRQIMLPELRQALKILALPLIDLKQLVEQELISNPFLEEIAEANPSSVSLKLPPERPSSFKKHVTVSSDADFDISYMTRKSSLQDILMRQLGMFTNTDREFMIGQEIVGNIDDNGYLKAGVDEIAHRVHAARHEVEHVLALVQKFEPSGVGARTLAECLLIQLDAMSDCDELLRKIIKDHLDDVAKNNYSHIAKCMKEPLGKVEICIKKIVKLDPKPGRNYSADEIQNIIPDIVIQEKNDELEILINNEEVPDVHINAAYKEMLKDTHLTPEAREFLKTKLHNALELLRAITRRHHTLRKVIDIIVEAQYEAIQNGMSFLRPMTFKDVALRIGMHESTICRVVMGKYVQTPHGIVALKDFFSSHVSDKDGVQISSNFVRRRIKELVEHEDRKHPVSDADITAILSQENGLKVARRTVAKYREELRILSSSFRRER